MPAAASPLVVRVRESLRSDKPLADIARESGYVRDALSRRLKREHGLGLRALRDQERLQIAQVALREAGGVGEAATRAGFDDPNYFTRWFRKQTGLTPTAWRRQ
jgi:AraC-like DNA-binding protein